MVRSSKVKRNVLAEHYHKQATPKSNEGLDTEFAEKPTQQQGQFFAEQVLESQVLTEEMLLQKRILKVVLYRKTSC